MKKVCSLFLIIVALISCSSCGAPNFVIKKYYRDKSNFKEYTAIVEGYGDFWNDSNMIYLDIGSSGGDLQTSSIYLFGENANIARKNQIWDVIRIGSEITFSASNAIFYDGYLIPMIALSCQGKALLEFAQGQKNQIDWFTFGQAKPTADNIPVSAESANLLDSLGIEENPDGSCRVNGILCEIYADNQNSRYDLGFLTSKFLHTYTNYDVEFFCLQGDTLECATESGFFEQKHIGEVFSLSASKDAEGNWILDSLVCCSTDEIKSIRTAADGSP